MDLLFSSSIRKSAVPTMALWAEPLPFSRSSELTIYVIKEEVKPSFYQIKYLMR